MPDREYESCAGEKMKIEMRKSEKRSKETGIAKGVSLSLSFVITCLQAEISIFFSKN